jgi:hypothetical protein
MSNNDHDRDNRDDHDHGHDDDNGGKAVVPAPTAAGAISSLTALAKIFNAVNTASIGGRSGPPMMQFKSRENNGTWMFGQLHTVPEEGSRWAVNLTTFKWGYICFGPNKKPLDERLVSVSLPKPNLAELPDLGARWQEEWAVNLECIDGADKGVEVAFKMNTDGGLQAIAGLFDTVRDRINGGQHDGNVVPILQKDSYQHSEYGRVWYPVLEIDGWMPLEGPAPAPKDPEPAPKDPAPAPQAPSSASEPQPRRRRVA